jgi:hypothetical protein
MKEFAVGQTVMIPCLVAPGAFRTEVLVTIELEGEKIAGFVKREFVQDNSLKGTVVEVKENWITVKLPGSYFTRASGRTRFPADWASANLAFAPA